jgi:alpha-L-fucosidase
MRVILKPGGVALIVTGLLMLTGVALWQSRQLFASPRVVKGTIRLVADQAQIHGSQVRVETKTDQPNIGYWGNPLEWVSWTVPAQANVTYEVSAKCAGPNPTTFTVTMDGQTLNVDFKPTGGYEAFTPIVLGKITARPGITHTLEVKPKDPAVWKAVNLMYVQLTPTTDKGSAATPK